MFRLKELCRMYRAGDGSSEFDDHGFIYHGSGALCLVAFFEKVFLPQKDDLFTSDITEERLRYVLRHIDEGASPEKAAGIRADLLAFLSFMHYGEWNPQDWSHLFRPEDERGGFNKEAYRLKWQ